MNQSEVERLADELLLRIRRRINHRWRPDLLSKRFNTNMQNIANAVKLLRVWGYNVKLDRDYVLFKSAPDILTATEIGYGLKTKSFGKTVHAYKSVKSTNSLASELALHGAAEGTIVVAEKQTLGRGRLGRSWHSPERLGIYLSIILRPSFSPEKAPGLSLMTALALADAVSVYCPGKVQIKWPNDILISGKKTAGILTELSAERSRIDYVIIGAGINVNQTGADFPETLAPSATSVRRSCRRKVFRPELAQRFLLGLEKEYALYRKKGLRPSLSRLRRYSSLIGKVVTLVSQRADEPQVRGRVVDIDSSGALMLEQDGKIISVAGGEVTVVA